jgi:hypothetical protein
MMNGDHYGMMWDVIAAMEHEAEDWRRLLVPLVRRSFRERLAVSEAFCHWRLRSQLIARHSTGLLRRCFRLWKRELRLRMLQSGLRQVRTERIAAQCIRKWHAVAKRTLLLLSEFGRLRSLRCVAGAYIQWKQAYQESMARCVLFRAKAGFALVGRLFRIWRMRCRQRYRDRIHAAYVERHTQAARKRHAFHVWCCAFVIHSFRNRHLVHAFWVRWQQACRAQTLCRSVEKLRRRTIRAHYFRKWQFRAQQIRDAARTFLFETFCAWRKRTRSQIRSRLAIQFRFFRMWQDWVTAAQDVSRVRAAFLLRFVFVCRWKRRADRMRHLRLAHDYLVFKLEWALPRKAFARWRDRFSIHSLATNDTSRLSIVQPQ